MPAEISHVRFNSPAEEYYHGPHVRTISTIVGVTRDMLTKQVLRAAVESGLLAPGIARNYGSGTHRHVCRWVGIQASAAHDERMPASAEMWITTEDEVPEASTDDLRRALLTCDPPGPAVKKACLDKLLKGPTSERDEAIALLSEVYPHLGPTTPASLRTHIEQVLRRSIEEHLTQHENPRTGVRVD